MANLAVYCGNSPGKRDIYIKTAAHLGTLCAQRGIGVVYGGGGVGMMGAVADAVLAQNGRVIGVIPRSMVEREWQHRAVADMRVVNSMHERKKIISKISDAFVALPGGGGTMDEFFEISTWRKLGHHTKPVGLLNVGGYFDHLLAFMSHMTSEGFQTVEHHETVIVQSEADTLLNKLFPR